MAYIPYTKSNYELRNFTHLKFHVYKLGIVLDKSVGDLVVFTYVTGNPRDADTEVSQP